MSDTSSNASSSIETYACGPSLPASVCHACRNLTAIYFNANNENEHDVNLQEAEQLAGSCKYCRLLLAGIEWSFEQNGLDFSTLSSLYRVSLEKFDGFTLEVTIQSSGNRLIDVVEIYSIKDGKYC